MYKYLHDVASDPAILLVWGLFTGLIGFLFGHKFSLIRDRRREFYDAADRLFRLIRREIDVSLRKMKKPRDEQ